MTWLIEIWSSIVLWPGLHPKIACFLFGLFVGANVGVVGFGLLHAAREAQKEQAMFDETMLNTERTAYGKRLIERKEWTP